MYSRYSGADTNSVVGECTAGTVGLIVTVYSRYIRADSNSVLGECTAGTVGLKVTVYWVSEQHVQWGQ